MHSFDVGAKADDARGELRVARPHLQDRPRFTAVPFHPAHQPLDNLLGFLRQKLDFYVKSCRGVIPCRRPIWF